jgi:ATP-dependent helicase/nuclease subunit B
MAVGFILGRSGTGKTSYCIRAVSQALAEGDKRQRLVMLVPEQATYQVERAILSGKRITGYSRLSVLSFSRLGFLLLGKNSVWPSVSNTSQQMIIHRILRENRNKLKALAPSVGREGLSREMAEVIVEFHRWGKEPEDVEEVIGRWGKDEGKKLTAMKFADIGLVFREYVAFIEGRFIDPDMQLTRALKAVGKAEFLRGARLWVDGFSGFTAGELAMLTELMKAAEETCIAICLDASKAGLQEPDEAGLFSPTERTYAELLEIVTKCKLRLAEPKIFKECKRFSSNAALRHVERALFEAESKKAKASGSVRIVGAANVRSEVAFVARQIRRLVREEGLRYRDIGVIASNIESYQHYIKAYFEDYELPFFIDRRRPLRSHPAIELICSALQVVSGGFLSSDIFAYLKNELVPAESTDIDLLENYCVAFGVTGKDWREKEEWRFDDKEEAAFDESQVNRIRWEVCTPLTGLAEKLGLDEEDGRGIEAAEFVRILFEFLEELGVRERIGEWVREAMEKNDTAAADENLQFYEKLVGVFDELCEVFGGEEMSVADYFSILSSAFSQLTLAFIPPTLDQVLVGSIERSRHPELKAVFLTGVTQKQFPSPIGYDRLLTDEDRMAAEAAGLRLAEGSAGALAERRYLAYIAFTRASKFLYVTYPLADAKGRAVARSQFTGDLEGLFTDTREEFVGGGGPDIEKVCTANELAEAFCRGLGRDSSGDNRERERLAHLLEQTAGNEELAGVGARVRRALDYENLARLEGEVAAELFGQELKTSATGLSSFAACPYHYFARYILEIQERKEFKLRPLDIGNFYHCVLDRLLKRLKSAGRDFAAISEQELIKILREEMAEFVQSDSYICNFARHSEHNAFIIRSGAENVEDCVRAIRQMVRAGEFRPAESEVWFGEEVEGSSGCQFGLSAGRRVLVRGKIDRIDEAEIEGRQVAIVFDYKRRDKSFGWKKLYHGLDMQLAIYMLAAINLKGIERIGGAFYMPVEAGAETIVPGEEAVKAEGFDYKAKGIFDGNFASQLDREVGSGWSKFYNFAMAKEKGQYGNYSRSGALKPEDFEKVLRFTEWKIVQLAEDIFSGRIDIKPYKLGPETGCGYCKYKTVCRFDWQINDYNYLQSLSKKDLLEEAGKVQLNS